MLAGVNVRCIGGSLYVATLHTKASCRSRCLLVPRLGSRIWHRDLPRFGNRISHQELAPDLLLPNVSRDVWKRSLEEDIPGCELHIPELLNPLQKKLPQLFCNGFKSSEDCIFHSITIIFKLKYSRNADVRLLICNGSNELTTICTAACLSVL